MVSLLGSRKYLQEFGVFSLSEAQRVPSSSATNKNWLAAGGVGSASRPKPEAERAQLGIRQEARAASSKGQPVGLGEGRSQVT